MFLFLGFSLFVFFLSFWVLARCDSSYLFIGFPFYEGFCQSCKLLPNLHTYTHKEDPQIFHSMLLKRTSNRRKAGLNRFGRDFLVIYLKFWNRVHVYIYIYIILELSCILSRAYAIIRSSAWIEVGSIMGCFSLYLSTFFNFIFNILRLLMNLSRIFISVSLDLDRFQQFWLWYLWNLKSWILQKFGSCSVRFKTKDHCFYLRTMCVRIDSDYIVHARDFLHGGIWNFLAVH